MVYWLITTEYPPKFGGGISTYCLHTAQMLQEKGWKVTVFVSDFEIKGIQESVTTEGIRIVRFSPNISKINNNLGYEAKLSYEFAHLIKLYLEKEGTPDILESQEYNGIPYYILQYKHLNYPKFKDLKVVVTLHAPAFLYLEYNKVNTFQFPNFWIGEMEKFCIKAADTLISPSQYLVSEIQSRFDISYKKVHVIQNPFKVDWDLHITPTDKDSYVFFGKLTPQKGCLELIEFFKQLWKEGFNYKLIMIGGGNHLYHPEGVDMIDYVKKIYKNELQENKLQLLGSIPPHKIKNYTDGAEVILIPSVVENLPYTVLETMAYGKIVLASMQGGQAEIIEDGTDGFLFDHHTPQSFINSIKRINTLSSKEIITVSNNAYKKIKENYSYQTVYEKKYTVISTLLKSEPNNDHFPFATPHTRSSVANSNTGVKDLLSVVIPYYNMGAYVEETIHSIINSTYSNIEIIIVNDGSTEKSSIEILATLKNKYAAIKILDKKNMGLSLARNDGASMASGEYLAFLDADDTVEPSYFEKAIEVLKHKKNIFFVGCWAKYFDEGGGIWPTFNPEPPYLLYHNMINSSALVYKKEAFIQHGLNDPKMIYGMEDYESVINMVKNGCQGVSLPQPLWNYRIRKKSMARGFNKEKQTYLYRLIANKHKDYYAIFAAEICNLLNTNGPGFNNDNPTKGRSFWGNGFLKEILVKTVKSNAILRKVAIAGVNIYKKYGA
jgi:glycosyltransferase involved in cell wall biosynthesis